MSVNLPPSFDVAAAHRFFSADCFNRAWTLIELPERTPSQEEELLRLTFASHWHWTRREDYAPDKASVGYWQISRVFALLGQADNARRFARRCLEMIEGSETAPFFFAYAHEALARAEALAGNDAEAGKHLETARRLTESVEDEALRKLILDDLETIA